VQTSSSLSSPAVWRVCADGRVERIPGTFDTVGGDLWRGTTDPVPSPDQHRLAFLAGGKIQVRDLDTGEERAVTALDDPQSRYRLRITAWAPDSQSLLYHVAAPLPPPSGDECAVLHDDNPVEFRLHDLVSGSDRRLEIPPRHGVRAWLPDGSLLLEDLAPSGHTWVTWKPGESAGHRVGPSGHCGPVVAQESERLLAACFDGGRGPGRIFSIRLSDGAVEPASVAGGRGTLWWPSVSPGGRVSFVQNRRTAGGDIDLSRVIVDEEVLYTCAGSEVSAYRWIGDEAIALRCRDDLVVVAADDGSVRSRTPLPER
jgi:hypothetical protein